jgi:hypothetical protein
MTPFTLPSLQLKTDWTSESDSPQFPTWGTCAITPGTPTAPMKVQFDPVQRPPGELWPNAYILHRNPYQAATQFSYVTNITFPTAADISACNAYEQDFQINDGTTIFNWGWQFLFGTGLRIWNRGGAEKWNNTRIPFTFTPAVPVPLVMTFAISGGTVVYLSASINGTCYPLNTAYAAVQQRQNMYLNNAVQVDSKGKGAPISLWVNEATVLGF